MQHRSSRSRMQFSFIFLLSLLTLAACGDTALEQGLIGGGAGAGTAIVLDGDVATGAVIGAVGNIAYCQTYPDRCN